MLTECAVSLRSQTKTSCCGEYMIWTIVVERVKGLQTESVLYFGYMTIVSSEKMVTRNRDKYRNPDAMTLRKCGK